jgi:hypothetical protein
MLTFLKGVYESTAPRPWRLPGGVVFSRRETALVSHMNDGTCVVYNIVDRMAYLLNETAGVVIRLTDGRRSIGAVAEMMCDLYGIDDRRERRRVAVDVRRIYRRLYRSGIYSREDQDR